MNTQSIQNNWSDIKQKIKSRWSKFNDNEIDGFKDNLDKVTSQIQKTYGIARDQAEREYNEFKKTLESAKDSVKDSVKSTVGPVVQTVKHPTVGTSSQEEDMQSEGGSSSSRKAL